MINNKASMHYGNDGDRIVVTIDRNDCVVDWYLVDKFNEVQDHGCVQIELYADDTWLAYWETVLGTLQRKRFEKFKSYLLKLFRKIGMREDEEFN